MLSLILDSFYPLYVSKTFGKEVISSTMTSIALSVSAVAGITLSFFHKALIAKLGKKNAVTLAILIKVITQAAFGALSLVHKENW